MPERSRLRAARLPSAVAAVLLLLAPLAGCALDPAEVPDSGATPARTIRATEPMPVATGAVTEGDEVSQLITRCLARYGLNERPPAPDGSLSETEWLAAQEAIADYDRTLTDCSAEALSTDAPAPTIAP